MAPGTEIVVIFTITALILLADPLTCFKTALVEMFANKKIHDLEQGPIARGDALYDQQVREQIAQNHQARIRKQRLEEYFPSVWQSMATKLKSLRPVKKAERLNLWELMTISGVRDGKAGHDRLRGKNDASSLQLSAHPAPPARVASLGRSRIQKDPENQEQASYPPPANFAQNIPRNPYVVGEDDDDPREMAFDSEASKSPGSYESKLSSRPYTDKVEQLSQQEDRPSLSRVFSSSSSGVKPIDITTGFKDVPLAPSTPPVPPKSPSPTLKMASQFQEQVPPPAVPNSKPSNVSLTLASCGHKGKPKGQTPRPVHSLEGLVEEGKRKKPVEYKNGRQQRVGVRK